MQHEKEKSLTERQAIEEQVVERIRRQEHRRREVDENARSSNHGKSSVGRFLLVDHHQPEEIKKNDIKYY